MLSIKQERLCDNIRKKLKTKKVQDGNKARNY